MIQYWFNKVTGTEKKKQKRAKDFPNPNIVGLSASLFHGDNYGDCVFSVVLPPVKSTTEPTEASFSTDASLCYAPLLSTSLHLSPPLSASRRLSAARHLSASLCLSPRLSSSRRLVASLHLSPRLRLSPPLRFSPPLCLSASRCFSLILSDSLHLSATLRLSASRRFSPFLSTFWLLSPSTRLSSGYLFSICERFDNFFSVISVTGNGDVFLDAQYTREGEMEDERVDLVLERIRNKYDWSSTDWPVLDPEESKMEEPNSHDRGSEADKSVDHTDVVADEETSSVKVAGKGKRKFLDEGAETRKKKVLLCKWRIWRECLQRGWGRWRLRFHSSRDAISLTGEGSYPSKKETEEAPLNSKAKQAPPKSKGAQAPPKSKGAEAPPKRKGDQPTPTKKDGKKIATETNDFDFGLSTQDLRDLSQATFVEGFHLSQVKVETSSKSKPFNMAPLQWNDEEIDRTKEDSPDAALVFFREEDWEKVRTWSTSSTRIRIGPATLDFEIANRLMDKSEWLNSLEIDAAMYVFRERTSLKRWRPHRVAFMTVVFSNMIKKEYGHLEAQGRKSYMLHNLLLQYGKGVLPPHGRTHEIWNIDVDCLYVLVHVSGNHWIALCISFVTRSIDVFDCSGRKRRHSYGVPSRCWCGKGVVIFYSRTDDNPYRRFYRCEIGAQIRRVEAEQGRIVEEIHDLKSSMTQTIEEEVRKQKNSLELGCLGSILWLFGRLRSQE
ncbi:hypothetical protein IGI04_023488 [Brassica rapa subsp. trilocularis]|uniref:Ubiquitin-like protease family profile domain-containing protein n=1 Tax=Brassica rapa subsp. trilocularis TaxID=1813537 RepID=A0ABQ7M405_BRACM|nr:hypothetical protein IGI04_023488 [Brassica rapa subsp. trilocularis]